jgi:hypothetical protein
MSFEQLKHNLNKHNAKTRTKIIQYFTSWMKDKANINELNAPKPLKHLTTKPTIHKRKQIPKMIRSRVWHIYHKDSIKGECYCCKRELDAFDAWHAGHIVPHANGGADIPSNLRPVCASCNTSMGTENMDEFKERYYPTTDLKAEREL